MATTSIAFDAGPPSQAWKRAGHILGSDAPLVAKAKPAPKPNAGKRDAKMTTKERLQTLPPAQKAVVLMMAGGIAGATAKSCVAPLERVKLLSQVCAPILVENCRLLLPPFVSSSFDSATRVPDRARTQSGETKLGVISTMQRVIDEEGVQGLWRGNTVNVLRMIPNKGVLHMTNDMYKDAIKHAIATIPACAAISHGAQHFLTGSAAGMTSVLATYPLDLIRTRMAGRLCSGDVCLPYSTWWETAKWTVENEGIVGLYRGAHPETKKGRLLIHAFRLAVSRSLSNRPHPGPCAHARGGRPEMY